MIFVGVYLLNLNRLIDPVTQQPRVSLVTGEGLAGTGRLSEHHERLLNGDGYHANHSRFSLSGRDSLSQPHGSTVGARRDDYGRHNRRDSGGSILFNAYDDHEDSVGLSRLDESQEEEIYNDETPSLTALKKKTSPLSASHIRTFNDGIPVRSSSNDAAHQLLDNDVPDNRSNHRR